LRYLASALRKGFGFEYLEQDKDLDPIRETPEFRSLVGATKVLQPAPSPLRLPPATGEKKKGEGQAPPKNPEKRSSR
jgi:hypothetical protein